LRDHSFYGFRILAMDSFELAVELVRFEFGNAIVQQMSDVKRQNVDTLTLHLNKNGGIEFFITTIVGLNVDDVRFI
jgi:hypothetical protein